MSKADRIQPKDVRHSKDLRKAFEEMLLLNDDGIIHILTATVLANRMAFDPVWLMIIAPSSGGKSAIIGVLRDLDFVTHISDLTVNTFASGMKKTGTETSLLLKLNNGIIAFKDFTSLLSKHRDDRKAIMAQLREIYDGEYDKQTGTGETIHWEGKIGAIAGATEAVYQHQEEFADMGDRFIMYNFDQPKRVAGTKKAIKNVKVQGELKKYIKECFHNYINFILKEFKDKYDGDLELSESSMDEVINIADFATRMRSSVKKDFKSGEVTFVPSEEMPMRMAQQMIAISSALVAMRLIENQGKGEITKDITDFERKIIYKVAFTSIPRTRRNVLTLLAKHVGGVTTAGAGSALNLPTSSVRRYLSEVNALGACIRKKGGGNKGDLWIMKSDSYRSIICRQEGVLAENSILKGDDEVIEMSKEDREWAESQDPNSMNAPKFNDPDDDRRSEKENFDSLL